MADIHQDTNFAALYNSIIKYFQEEQSSTASMLTSKAGTLSEDDLLNSIARLSPALFEKLVFKFDSYNSVPGREASQLIRATELLRLVKSQKDGFVYLSAEVEKIIGG